MFRASDRMYQRRTLEGFQQEAIECHYITLITPSGGSPIPAQIGGGNYDTSYVQSPLYTEVVSIVYAGVEWIDPGVVRFGMAPPGPELGDVVLRMDLHYQSYLSTLADNRLSYMLVNGKYVRPRENLAMRVTGPTTLEIRAELVNVKDIVQVIAPETCDGTQLIFSCPENSGHLATTGWFGYG